MTPRIRVARVDVDSPLYDEVRELDRVTDLGVEPSEGTYWFAATHHGEVVGYAGAIEWQSPTHPAIREYFLSRAGVRPEWRGRGIQKRLIRARVRHARTLGHEAPMTYTSPGNPASMRSLISCGFRPYFPTEGRVWFGDWCVYWQKST